MAGARGTSGFDAVRRAVFGAHDEHRWLRIARVDGLGRDCPAPEVLLESLEFVLA